MHVFAAGKTRNTPGNKENISWRSVFVTRFPVAGHREFPAEAKTHIANEEFLRAARVAKAGQIVSWDGQIIVCL